MHIKADDTVQVIAGNDRGKQGRVLSIDRKNGKLVVEGCNRVYKHVRRSQKNPQGGRLSKEMPLQISNVLLVCNRCGVGVRTGARLTSDGIKERFCRKCSTALGQIAPAKEKQAAK
ncbi:MAG: 50S ribosomal protein L24 [Planctomycetaceae bacterium]|nr:50S ribosomal protein L24 [Planctomycetales bacterium]MCB9926734.1 50S ribosomal protein L24 [Planctomycetaceae bacterium]